MCRLPPARRPGVFPPPSRARALLRHARRCRPIPAREYLCSHNRHIPVEVGPDTSTYRSLLFPLSLEQTRSSRATVEDPAGVAADPLESHRDLGSSRGLHNTVAQRPPSDGRVESKIVVEPAHEYRQACDRSGCRPFQQRPISPVRLVSWHRGADRSRWRPTVPGTGRPVFVFDVTGTTVTTPRPKSYRSRLAPSLPTITADRIRAASTPTTLPRFTTRISPRRIMCQTPSATVASHASS